MRDKLFRLKLRRRKRRYERYRREYLLNKAYAKYLPERKKRKVSNIMLVIIVTAITSYTIASFWLTYVTGVSIDGTLTTCFYTFWGSELVALTTLKTAKIVKNYSKNENDSADSDQDEACG